MSELNKSLERLTTEVDRARQETAENTLAITRLAAQFEARDSWCGLHQQRLAAVELASRDNTRRLDVLTGKGAIVAGLFIIAAQAAVALVVGLG